MKTKVVLFTFITQIFLIHSVSGYQFDKTARLKDFNQNTAMLLIFGEYNVEHKGTLIPVKKKYTESWNTKKAYKLAMPKLCVTYKEGDIKKGVIVIEQQTLGDNCRACTAIISVYVFRYNGNEWVFDNGKKEVINAGAWGKAPYCELIKIGDRKYGILFKEGYTSQGFNSDSAFIIAISEWEPYKIFSSVTGENNGGDCYGEKKERNGWCYGYDCELIFLKQDNTDYYVLNLKCEGTDHNNEPVSDDLYRFVNGFYR